MNFDYEFKFKADGSDIAIDLPFPQETEGSFTWDYEEVCTDGTHRAEDAEMNKKVIAEKRALTVKYSKLPHSQYARIHRAIKGTKQDKKIFGELTYPDVENPDSPNSTRRFYTGNLSATTLGYRDYNSGEILVSTQIKFIEQ